VAGADEHVDVLIVGAGLSGIGIARYLRDRHPQRSLAILEARDASGGTWDLFRYPGVRSDSDLATFAYRFRPWTGEKAFADGPEILRYIRETAAEAGLDRDIRYGHRVVRASWSTPDARWTVEAERTDTGAPVRMTAGWLFSATGYYRYDEGHAPALAGLERFRGPVVHPQRWPEDLDVAGRRVVVIGSGATAVTLVPALAREGAQVTMLQRSPSYVISLPAHDPLAVRLRRRLGDARGHRATRRKNILLQRGVFVFCRRWPRLARRLLRGMTARQLPERLDVDAHFRPAYDPWDQRLCVAPDGDFFRALRDGDADLVTDRIDSFSEHGVRLASGRLLEADVVVTATGLRMQVFGGVRVEVDGTPLSLPDTVAFRGMMLGGVPNLAFAVGYTNASWTLKVDLVGEHFCRLLAHMDERGYDQVVPVGDAAAMETRPLLDLTAGYVRRSLHELPRQGTRPPWRMAMSYLEDVRQLRRAPVAHAALRFSRLAPPAAMRDNPTTMLDILLTVLLVVLLAVMAGAVAAGRWASTWAASGRTPAGRRYPGGPTHP
jgi:cation diffusion facilitator CzcD-associated flavoprotein CzcO